MSHSRNLNTAVIIEKLDLKDIIDYCFKDLDYLPFSSEIEQTTESRKDYIKRLRSVELEEDEITLIDGITDQIEDEEIRDSLRELFTSQAQLSKIRDSES